MNYDLLNKKIQRWKANLIDLSKRNRLLNFKENANKVIKFKEAIDDIYQTLSDDKMILVKAYADIQKFIDKEKRGRKKKHENIEENVEQIRSFKYR